MLCHFEIPQGNINRAHIVPNITQYICVFFGSLKCSFDAVIENFVLPCCETAEGDIVPNLGRVIPQLDKPLVQLERNLALILVVVIGCDVGHGFDITVLQSQSLKILSLRLFKPAEVVIEPPHLNIELRLVFVHLGGLSQYRQRFLYIVLLAIDAAQVQERLDIVVVFR